MRFHLSCPCTLVVEVGFDQAMNFINESIGLYEVCVFLSGQIERNVSVQIISVPSSSPGEEIFEILC